MSFLIQRGLFNSDFTDHHAVLGIPLDADAKEIRKRYLKVARALHPDSFATSNDAEKQQATELLSKLVNPAYEALSQEKNRAEYTLLIKLKGQQALRQQESIEVASELARQLVTAKDIEQTYRHSLEQLAEQQYQFLDQSLELTGQISELNLIYLIRKTAADAKQSTTPATPTIKPTTTARNAPPRPQLSLVEQFYRRAQGHINDNNMAKAILELREALQVEPNNASCHSLLGFIYFKQNQATMAKIHFTKALQLSPDDEMATKGLQKVQKMIGVTQSSSASTASQKSSKPDKPGGFFGLFGGKKN